MKTLKSAPELFLRHALRANAIFSILSAFAFLSASSYFAKLVGIGSEGFVSLGVNLAVFAILLLGLSSGWSLKRIWPLFVIALVVLLDALWVLGSFAIASTPSMATHAGKAMIMGIACIVGAFALLQAIALISLAMKRWKNRHRTSILSSATVALMLCISLAGCSLADLRTPSLREADITSATEQGTALLQRVAQAHGHAAWQSYETQEVVLVDAWQAKSWWPAQEQSLSLKSILGTFTAQASFLDGPQAAERWGIQSWRAYKRDVSGNLIFLYDEDSTAAHTFYLPSLHYFNELPFRMLKADLIAYAGERIYRDKTYDLIFATWGSFEPNETHDQYLLWIDRETNLIEMCQYTLRDAAPAYTGTIHFDDYRMVQGVVFPFKQTVTIPAPEHTLYPLDEYFFHQSRVDSVAFDAFEKEELIVDESRIPGDVKM